MNKEEKLIADCLTGKRKAQNELYNRFAPVAYGLCLRYANNPFEAQEMLQEGFIKVFSSLASFSSKGSFEGWVKRIVVDLVQQDFNNTYYFNSLYMKHPEYQYLDMLKKIMEE